jgi:hypothetical protein
VLSPEKSDFGWFWLVLVGFGWFWLVLVGFVGFEVYFLLATDL